LESVDAENNFSYTNNCLAKTRFAT